MVGRGGCFKRQSPLANQAALVEAASARLGIAEPRVVPCAAQTSEQYRYVSHRPRPPLPLLHLQRHPHNFPARAFASALLPLSLCLLPRPCRPSPSLLLGGEEGRSNSGVSTFPVPARSSLLPLRSQHSRQSLAWRSPQGQQPGD